MDLISYKKAREAKEMVDGIVDGEVDKGALRTKIDQKLNALESQYAPKLDSLTSQMAHKAEQSYVDTKINAMATGTPKIIVQYFTDLPGTVTDEKLALVLEDGHKYYYNGTSWVDAGVYQATESNNFVATNLVNNGNFATSSGWSVVSGGGTAAAANNKLLMTAGSTSTEQVIQRRDGKTIKKGHILYLRGIFTTPTTNVSYFRIELRANNYYGTNILTKSLNTPAPNQSYILSHSGMVNFETSDQLAVIIRQKYNVAGEGNITEAEYLLALDLTDIFGSGNEPTTEEMDAILNKFPFGWFDGTTDLLTLKEIYHDTNKTISNIDVKVKTIEDKVNNIKGDEGEEGLVDINASYWEDFTFVNDQMWGFGASDTTPDGLNSLVIFDAEFARSKILKHNFGHCNTIDYHEGTDSLIFGNGGQDYNTDGIITIMQNVTHWNNFAEDSLLDISGINGTIITNIALGTSFGSKINVIWGEDNLGKHNICYVLSNDNKNIRKLLLGQGTNQFENGTFKSGRTSSQYNGTYKILGEWTIPYIDANQGTCYYNGYVYGAIGHDGLWAVRLKLKSDGTVDTEQRKELFYTDAGQKIDMSSAGLAIQNGFVYQGMRGSGMMRLFKCRVF